MTFPDDTLMLAEDETLALLRAGRTGIEPPLTDVTPLALRGGERARRRRHVGQVGAGLLATAAACAAVFAAMPGLSPDARSDVAIAEGAGDPAAITEEEAHAVNLRVLAEALGPDFRVSPPDGSAYVAPVPGSSAAVALPPGFSAEADVVVTSAQVPCKPDPEREGTTTACQTITAADGRDVELESRSGSIKPQTPAEMRTIRLTQTDGDVVSVILRLEPEILSDLTTRVPREELLAWTAPYVDRLVTAATDARMAPGSIRERAEVAGPNYAGGTPHERNVTILSSLLGPSFERTNGRLWLIGESEPAMRLPGGLGAVADIESYREKTRFRADCDPPICAVRTIPDRGTAYVYNTGLDPDPGLEGPSLPSIVVLFDRGDRTWASVGVHITNALPREAYTVAVADWLRSFEEVLVAAASNPAVEVEPPD